ncbi:CgeB family protein [Microbaculum marinum]|uniref:Glycosyltransferase n=1 Tax=Microbaculum marinum TaxID=1764581 RepID=A0AAW9RSS7_9HYPH
MRMRALGRLGHTVHGTDTGVPWRQASWLRRQIGRRLQSGSIVEAINHAALAAAADFQPDLVWAEKQEYLRRETLEEMRRLGARLVHFTPDPYFSLQWKRTPLMDQAMGAFDVLVYCKTYELADYSVLGKPLIYMPLGYCDEVHRPLPSGDSRWACEVGFLGGWEPRRESALHSVARTGADLKIWGGYWDFLADGRWTPRRRIILGQLAGSAPFRIRRDDVLAPVLQGGEVYGDDYARALTGSQIGLGFLRSTWPDQHTTRTFEIPACGSMLLADRSDEHRDFFEEGKEAEFFSSTEELVDKVRYYVRNETERQRIAQAGLKRCAASGYSYLRRLEVALGTLKRVGI